MSQSGPAPGQELGEAVQPLAQPWLAVHQYERRTSPVSDERGRHHGLAGPRRSDQHSDLVTRHGVDGNLLRGGQGAGEAQSDGLAVDALVLERHSDAVGVELLEYAVKAAARKQQLITGLLVAHDHAGRLVRGQPGSLAFEEDRVGECGSPAQPVPRR